MESITLFPKLHLEVCDEFSCDNDDDDLMTIETEVALKVCTSLGSFFHMVLFIFY